MGAPRILRTLLSKIILFSIFLLFFGGCSANGADPSPTLTISAAASLTFAFEEIAPLFERETGIALRYNFGSSGQLTHQIEQGAPVDLFAAASMDYIEELEQQGLILAGSKAAFARGSLVLWTRADRPTPLERLEDLQGAEVERFAMANPDYAPYGVAARQALQRAGLWNKLQARLVLGQNVRQTLHYAETGNVDAALVARSLCRPNGGHWVDVPESLYTPIYQALAVVARSPHPHQARRFAAFLATPRSQAILRRHGFNPPDQEQLP